MDTSPGTPGGSPDQPAIFFRDAAEWAAWLKRNHETSSGMWMGLYKKHVEERGLTWADAVVEALRFGWIDSQAQRIDHDATRQRWTPRRPGSVWSKVNVATVERLIAQGRMEQPGLLAYKARRPEREGIYAYERDAVLPPEYQVQLGGNQKALAFWEVAPAGYRRICTHWVVSAKQAKTRDRRMATLIQDCAEGRMIRSQRYGDEPAWLARARAATR